MNINFMCINFICTTFMNTSFMNIFIFLLLLCYLIICCYTDLKTHTISLCVSAVFLIIGIIISILFCKTSFSSVIISTLPGIFLLFTAIIFPASLGTGDGLIFIICGIYSGINFTMQVLLLCLLISCFFSLLLIIKKHSLKYQFPLAPFILVSCIFCFLLNIFQ